MSRLSRTLTVATLAAAAWLPSGCGDLPTTPSLLEFEVPRSSLSVAHTWEDACDPDGLVGWAMIDEFGLLPVPHCISATPSVLAQGESTLFAVTNAEMVVGPVWIYHEGDTLEMVGDPPVGPEGPEGGEVICPNGVVCPYTPQVSGRVYLMFWVSPTRRAALWGPVVTVGDSTPDPCSVAASGAAGGPLRADDGSLCPPDLADTLKVACQPNPVVRGQLINCTAFVDPPGSTLQVREWRFFGATGSRKEASSSAAWPGIMVESGTIEVDAYVAGALSTASAQVVVDPRNWSNVTPPFTVTEQSPGPLPPNPTRIGHLGGVGFVPVDAGAVQSLREVPSGPNAGLHYLTKLPYGVEARVHVHTTALSIGSLLWQSQRNTQWANAAGDMMCARKDVVPFATVVRQHEGIGLAPRSHARLYRDSIFQIAGPALEGVVGAASHEALGKAGHVFTSAMNAAKSASAQADSPANRPTYCYFTGIIY